MKYRLIHDLVIPAGTEVGPAPVSTIRTSDHGEVLIALDRDGTASLTFDIGEAEHAKLIEPVEA